MIRFIGAAALLVLATSPSASSTSSFFCAGELSTGVKWLDGGWRETHFDASNQRYLLRPIEAAASDPMTTHGVFSMGETEAKLLCRSFPSADRMAGLSCTSPGASFIFVKSTMRFEHYFGLGYLQAKDDENSSTTHVTVGKCTPLE